MHEPGVPVSALRCHLCHATRCPTDAQRQPLVAGWRLWRGDDGWVVCSECCRRLVNVATEDTVHIRIAETCIHGVSMDAPTCPLCRLEMLL